MVLAELSGPFVSSLVSVSSPIYEWLLALVPSLLFYYALAASESSEVPPSILLTRLDDTPLCCSFTLGGCIGLEPSSPPVGIWKPPAGLDLDPTPRD